MRRKLIEKMPYLLGDGERDLEASKRANIDYIMVHWGFSDYRDEEAVSSVEELYNRIVEA